MKFLLAAVSAATLALTPVAASAQPADTDPITTEEVQVRAMICLKLMNGELTAQQVVQGMKLDTPRKERDFVLQCRMLVMGGLLGQQAAKQNGTSI